MSKKQHISRLAAPRTWPIRRKGIKWIAKPSPGVYNLSLSLPLIVVLRDLLKVVKTSKEAKFILHSKDVLVNSKPIRDVKFSVGIFDTISLPKLKQYYRLVFGKNKKLGLIEIPEKETNLIPIKISNKTTMKKNKSQLNLSNGWNILSKEKFQSGDSILFNISTKKIEKKFALESGNVVYIIGGKHAGMVAKLKEISKIGELKKEKIATLTPSKDETVSTNLEHIFVVGGDKPAVKVE
jgi:small subunit ribosomal protein S4e